jgi:hypothetical protein
VREATQSPIPERRVAARADRRKQSRSGRRNDDPHVNWRRVAWLFAGYALYISARSLPATVKAKILRRPTPS